MEYLIRPIQTWHTQLMLKVNPLHVLRNHLLELAINDAEQGDFNCFYRLLDQIQNPFENYS